MKKILFLISIASLAAACGNHKLSEDQPKAEALIKAYLKDSSGYKPLSFDTLREVHQSFIIADPEGRKLDSLSRTYSDSALAYRKKADEAIMANKTVDTPLIKRYHAIDATFAKKSDSVAAIIAEKGKAYQGQSFQYNILHTYDLTDNLGHSIKHTTNFWIDSGLQKVLQQQEAN